MNFFERNTAYRNPPDTTSQNNAMEYFMIAMGLGFKPLGEFTFLSEVLPLGKIRFFARPDGLALVLGLDFGKVKEANLLFQYIYTPDPHDPLNKLDLSSRPRTTTHSHESETGLIITVDVDVREGLRAVITALEAGETKCLAPWAYNPEAYFLVSEAESRQLMELHSDNDTKLRDALRSLHNRRMEHMEPWFREMIGVDPLPQLRDGNTSEIRQDKPLPHGRFSLP